MQGHGRGGVSALESVMVYTHVRERDVAGSVISYVTLGHLFVDMRFKITNGPFHQDVNLFVF